MVPADISAALGLEGHHAHRAGDPRRTPTGTALAGNYPDNRWRHVVRHTTLDQHFVEQLRQFLSQIKRHKPFFAEVRANGGSAGIVINFLGDGYFGDEIPSCLLKKIAHLGLDLGIECFPVPQN